MLLAAITGVGLSAFRKKRIRLREKNTVEDGEKKNTVEDGEKSMLLRPCRQKKKKTIEEESPEEREKKKLLAYYENREAERKKRIPLTVVSGEELEAHKAEWCAEYPDYLPWKSTHGAGMDDETQWPPIWKERIEECPEYEALVGYLRPHHPHSMNSFKMLVDQLQESRGYDVSCSVNGFLSLSRGMVRENKYKLTKVCRYVTAQINERAQKYGEFYVFDEIKKITSPSFMSYFYTFTVKETTSDELKTVQAYLLDRPFNGGRKLVYLKEWRFKPKI